MEPQLYQLCVAHVNSVSYDAITIHHYHFLLTKKFRKTSVPWTFLLETNTNLLCTHKLLGIGNYCKEYEEIATCNDHKRRRLKLMIIMIKHVSLQIQKQKRQCAQNI